ncbi:MAG: hypothetical protein ACR2LL_11090 [Nitrosopumilus sp.]
MGSKLDYVTGKQLEADHNSALFSHIPGSTKKDSKDNFSVYSQFIPICTSEDSTSFDYGARIDDKTLDLMSILFHQLMKDTTS